MDFKKTRSLKPSTITTTTTICKKHPKHQQSPGVCSICLNEKLSRLSTASFRRRRGVVTVSSSSSSLSSVSSLNYSSNASSSGSPRRGGRMETRSGPLFMMRDAGRDVLTKSRSMANVWRKKEGDHFNNKTKRKRLRNILSKLLRIRGKRVNEG